MAVLDSSSVPLQGYSTMQSVSLTHHAVSRADSSDEHRLNIMQVSSAALLR
jgi:hypothetical protein